MVKNKNNWLEKVRISDSKVSDEMFKCVDFFNRNNLICPRCKVRLFFQVIADKRGKHKPEMWAKCCGSEYGELVEDWGLEDDILEYLGRKNGSCN